MSPRVHLINPSELSVGVAVITPRWLYVLAAATGTRWGDPLMNETLEALDVRNLAGQTLVAAPHVQAACVQVLGSFIRARLTTTS
jgi:hypothetical protein